MCGRITQKSPPDQLGLTIILGTPDDPRVPKAKEAAWMPRYNGAPGQEHWVIRQNHKTGERSLDRLWSGLIPSWSKDSGRKPINAKAETVASLPMFRDAYRPRRCTLPIDNFFEWKALRVPRQSSPMPSPCRTISPSAWQPSGRIGSPRTQDGVRTFAVITCPANEMVAAIHDRMPVILPAAAYDRWLSCIEPDPRDLLVPFAADRMVMWPISTRMNAVANDDADVLAPIEPSSSAQRLL